MRLLMGFGPPWAPGSALEDALVMQLSSICPIEYQAQPCMVAEAGPNYRHHFREECTCLIVRLHADTPNYIQEATADAFVEAAQQLLQ